MQKVLLGALAGVFGLALSSFAAVPAKAAGDAIEIPKQSWSFDGVFGTFDRAALQRGLQVYREICSGCHSLDLIAFRNLADLGYNEDEVKAIAAEYTMEGGPNDEGEMFEREGLPSDYFPAPFANAKAAAASNSGAVPPDLSLMAKARKGGADYIYALLIGYSDPPADVELTDGQNYNAYFPGHKLAMAAPLYGDDVEYQDGTPATLEQVSSDLTAFLTWTAEPMLEDRRRMGIKVLLFLLVLTGLLYAAKRKVWSDLH